MLHVFGPAGCDLLQSQGGQVGAEDGGCGDLVIDVLEEVVYAGSEGHHCGVDREVVSSVVEVVGDHLQAEVRHRVEALLRQEDRADAFRPLQMAKLERYELL